MHRYVNLKTHDRTEILRARAWCRQRFGETGWESEEKHYGCQFTFLRDSHADEFEQAWT